MALSVPKLPVFRPPFSGSPPVKAPRIPRFTGAGAAGPRRILTIAGCGVAVAAVLVGATLFGDTPPLLSRPGRLPHADPVPGGVRSNPHQDDLALRDAQEAAAREQAAGRSFTPQIPSGREYSQQAAAQPLLTAPSPPPPQPAAPRTPAPAQVVAAKPAAPAAGGQVVKVADQGGQAQGGQPDPRYKTAIDKMMGGWGNRPPRTDVILPPEAESAQAGDGPRGVGRGAADAGLAAATPIAARPAHQRVLIPAGRGVHAHAVMGANSDAPGPVVLEADSGPIARSRLIGGFTREGEYLVIRGSRIVHAGREINAEWIVVSPSTMETAVASSVDQHYASRFLLPAAAAFVQGLGQAVALSNSAVVASPFGGVSAFQRLNPTQQLGVAAGVAAGRVGQALDQAAPRGPTVRVDKDAALGVMFLSNVVLPE